jgi:hypothetical protein
MARQGTHVNFVALLNGLAEELGMPTPMYHPDRPPAVGLHSAVCRFGVASESGTGHNIESASLMFVGKARSLPKCNTFQLLHSTVNSSLTPNIRLGT